MSLAEEKSRLIELGRFAETNRKKRGEGKLETFDFLGFRHYCSKSKNGKFRVKRETSKKKFAKKCKEIHKYIGEMRTLGTAPIIKKVNQILTAYFHYYGIIDNNAINKKYADGFFFALQVKEKPGGFRVDK